MLKELQRRNYSQGTIATYLRTVQDLALYCGQPPDRLGPEQVRRYQVHLLRERKLAVTTVRLALAALRFFFGKILRQGYTVTDQESIMRILAEECRCLLTTPTPL